MNFHQLCSRILPGRVALTSFVILATLPLSEAQNNVSVLTGIPSPIPGSTFQGIGENLALNGTDLLVGRGAWHYEEVSDGVFQLVSPLQPPWLGVPYYGFDLAIDGNVAVVGSPGSDETGHPGRPFIFERIGGEWIYQSAPLAYDSYDEFGRSAIVHGDRILAGAPRGGPLIGPGPTGHFSTYGPGRVHCYTRLNGSWVVDPDQPFIDPQQGEVGAEFGISMDLSGDWLLIGQWGSVNHGAELHHWNGSQWEFHTELGPGGVGTSVGAPVATGVDVAIDGHLAVVGASAETVNGVAAAGGAWVFEYSEGAWQPAGHLVPPDPSDFALFGGALDVDAASERILIGSRRWGFLAGTPRVGAAYLYTREVGGGWTLAERLEPNPPIPTTEFGADVQINDHLALIGGRDLGVYVHTPQMSMTSALAADITCDGDGGNQAGCTDCPCGNNAVPGTSGGCLNSLGRSANLRGERSISVSTGSFAMHLDQAAPSTFALLGSGNASSVAPGCPPGSGVAPFSGTDGLRCLAGTIRRHGVLATDEGGEALWTDLVSASGFQAGETRHFQAIYRDATIGPCGYKQNTTNAVTILFLP